MSKGKSASEKMQRVVRKLQRRIGNNNQQYQKLSPDAASLRIGVSLPKRTSLSGLRQIAPESDDEPPDFAPSDVPQGFLAVYVGSERQRFVISAASLKHQKFKELLEKSAEEYGFAHKGGLNIACDVVYFEYLLRYIKGR
ncbi:protein SMALL AUXIN UP-REGULATED RNA 12 [Physcomitrium patens]|uniref:Uncharacterized protein n=1 Tax=Physcomitrium patens TaxID=3218 RepID=A0A2K1JMV5_PHYPA|nr:auxin-responsive protein SAUR19-like [Physcomitrium patens]PNR42726.1 hypothetical protein PHYPA_017556 [Physcomitrium patens]|eukprot:XP_024392280.1 auxin-responsive protein SAUR19-like [Physcomitrella patens]